MTRGVERVGVGKLRPVTCVWKAGVKGSTVGGQEGGEERIWSIEGKRWRDGKCRGKEGTYADRMVQRRLEVHKE